MVRVSRYHQGDNHLLDDFYVISVISNPVRFESRYDLYMNFKKEMEEAGVKLFTVELQQGDRSFQITESENPMHLQLRTYEELWFKESMINLALSRLPKGWKYCAWIDADISFTNKNWAIETVQQLQHYHIVQLFSHAIDLGPNGELVQTHNGFVWSYQSGKPWGRGKGYSHFHPGYGWAATREALDLVGGLIDKSILGAGDHHMACALIGKAEDSFPKGIESAYAKYILKWQARAERHLKRDIGYVNGTIYHHWHGKKKDRRYVDRWEILINNSFKPEDDLYRDTQGLYILSDSNIKLRDDIRQYFRSRLEDSQDLE